MLSKIYILCVTSGRASNTEMPANLRLFLTRLIIWQDILMEVGWSKALTWLEG